MTCSILFYGPKAVVASRDLPDVVKGAINGRVRFTAAERERYRQIQAAIPAGRPFLSTLAWPILFDQNRNPLFNPDNIGSVSPPPGIPLSGGAEELAAYLRRFDLYYVACPTPAECERSSRKWAVRALKQFPPGEKTASNLWIYSLELNESRAMKLFGELASRYPLLYDDGKTAIIDLHDAKTPSTGIGR